VSLTPEQVRKVATLARLQVDDDQVDAYARELSNILDLVETLEAADTASVEPMAHPLDLTARLRDDAVTEGDEREVFQAIAPAVESGVYLVPKVIE
jgi:aspartyl-tRNA(Asn)/glutamyl-tRNA(Gln) amidotransferase subunit C